MSKTHKAFWLGLLAIVAGCGYLFLLPRFSRGAEARVRNLEPQNAAAIQSAVPGTAVLIEGELSLENEGRYRGMAAYRQTFSVEGFDRQRVSIEEDRVTPPLLIDVADGAVRVEEGYRIQHTTRGWQTKDYHYSGFNPGDNVLVVGTITPSGTIKAEFIAGGTRQDYLWRRIGETWSSYISGLCLIVIGFLTVVGALMVWRARASARRHALGYA